MLLAYFKRHRKQAPEVRPPNVIDPVQRDVIGIMLLAFLIRMAWLIWGAWMQHDSSEYLTLAQNIAFRHVFSLNSLTEPALPTAFRPPLFPGLIAAMWWGNDPPVSAVLFINVLLGTFTAGLVYLIAKDVFDRRTAMLAGVAFSLAPMTCFFTVTILTESLFTFLVTAGAYFWKRNGILAGIFFGLATLTRPVMLPFLAGLMLLPILPVWRRSWRLHLMIGLTALAVSSIWIARNAIVFHRFIPVAASGWGTNLICGSMETDIGGHVWTGTSWAALDLKTHPLTVVEGNLSDAEKDRVLIFRALNRIANDPGHWFAVRTKQYPKLFIDNGDYLLGDYNLPLREALKQRRWLVVIVKSIFISVNLLVIALGTMGIFFERRRLESLSHIILFPIFGALIQLPAWIEPRYFLPMMPLVFILAASACTRIWQMTNVPIPRSRFRESG